MDLGFPTKYMGSSKITVIICQIMLEIFRIIIFLILKNRVIIHIIILEIFLLFSYYSN